MPSIDNLPSYTIRLSLCFFILTGVAVLPTWGQVRTDSLWYEKIEQLEAQEAYESVLVYADSLIQWASVTEQLTAFANGHLYKAQALRHLNQDDQAGIAYDSAISTFAGLADASGQARALFAKGNFHFGNDEYEEALSVYALAYPLFVTLGDTLNAAKVLNQTGVTYDYQGNYPEAMPYFEQALSLFSALGDTYWMAKAINNIGILHDLQGNYDEAISYYQRSLELMQDIGDQIGIASALNNLGIVHRIQGNHEQALDFYKRSLAIREEFGHKRDIASSLNNIGVILELEGEYAEALDYHVRSLQLKEELGNKRGMASSLGNIGKIHAHQGNYDEAFSFFDRALALDTEAGNKNGIASMEHAMGVLQSHKGNYDLSLTHFFNALAIKEAVNDPKGQAASLVGIGNVYSSQGLLDEALSIMKRAMAINEKLDNKLGIARAANNIGDIYTQQEEYQDAIAHYSKSLAIREALNDKQGMASVLGNLGDMHLKQHNLQEALMHYDRALQLDLELGNKPGIVARYTGISATYVELERFDEALLVSEDALYIADSIGALTQVSDIHKQRTTIFERKGDYKGALESFQAYKTSEDSLFTSESQSVIAELQERYRTKEQEQHIQLLESQREVQRLWMGGLAGGILLLSVIAFLGYSGYRTKRGALAELNETHTRLKLTQDKLIHQEKMASLGQLTAGIAHEIRNPLNFIYNFSKLNKELIEELEGVAAFQSAEAKQLVEDLKLNESVIIEHGVRANRIVSSMMEHTRGKGGEPQSVQVNRFLDEYLNLAIHGAIASNSSLDVDIERSYDVAVGDVELIPQEVGQVLASLFNNALDSMAEKKTAMNGAYNAKLSVATRWTGDNVEIKIADNGLGIPGRVQDKVFEPFFTTKPPGSGTGLGLSISYDIIVKGHGGELEFESEEGAGTHFLIKLPA